MRRRGEEESKVQSPKSKVDVNDSHPSRLTPHASSLSAQDSRLKPQDDEDLLRQHLLELAADLGDGRQMALLGEGNVSAAIDDDRFLVKASGTRLSSLKPEHLVEVRTKPIHKALDGRDVLDDEQIETLLLASRSDPTAMKPSVETLFHAALLRLPGIRFVGHNHPIYVNQILCSPLKEIFATKRLFPDQIVYCGAESVLVPYVDPGLILARAIAEAVGAFRKRQDRLPKTILLENHGIIALGTTHTEVIAAITMAEKAAQIFVGAAKMGGPIFMKKRHVRRIDTRRDEHYRQKMLRS